VSVMHVASSPIGIWTRGGVCRLIGCVLLICYAVSFFLPTTNTPEGPGDLANGLTAFFLALAGIAFANPIGKLMCLGLWLANPLFWAGTAHLMTGRPRVAAIYGTIASILIAPGLLLNLPWIFIGGYVWAASIVGLAVAGWIVERRRG
jgi:hypothetical protein